MTENIAVDLNANRRESRDLWRPVATCGRVTSEASLVVTQEGLHSDAGVRVVAPGIRSDGPIQEEAKNLGTQSATNATQALLTLLVASPRCRLFDGKYPPSFP